MNQNVQTRSVSLKTQRQIDFVSENIAVISIPPAEVPVQCLKLLVQLI